MHIPLSLQPLLYWWPSCLLKRGETYEFEGTWHIDEVNLIDLEKLVREVGVKGEYTIWYAITGGEVKDGLRAIKIDGKVYKWVQVTRKCQFLLGTSKFGRAWQQI